MDFVIGGKEMKIFYQHIKCNGFKIYLQNILEEPYKEITYNNMIAKTKVRYFYKDIPFSNDFKMVCLEDEFTLDELRELHYSYISGSYGLYNKNKILINKLENKIENLMKVI
jgi:hypothetical protein